LSLCFAYFGDRVLLFAQASLDHDALILGFLWSLGQQALPPDPDFSVQIGFCELQVAWLASKCNLPDLNPSSYDYRSEH
jgi:hypothetical protein